MPSHHSIRSQKKKIRISTHTQKSGIQPKKRKKREDAPREKKVQKEKKSENRSRKKVKDDDKKRENVNILNGVYYMCAIKAHTNKICYTVEHWNR